MLNTKTLFILWVLLVSMHGPPAAVKADTLQHEAIIVTFDPPLRRAAEEVEEIYPMIKSELENTFGWKIDFRPTVVITKDKGAFQRTGSSPLIVAYAVPRKNLVVIDYSKMHTHPFTVGITLKHELSHLLLHHHIQGNNLPKWLDEGLAQWASGGIAEILTGKKQAALHRAALSDRLIRLSDLSRTFPKDEKGLLLAYEESKSVVEYIHGKFGSQGILTVLRHLKAGKEIDFAVRKGLSISLDELELNWHRKIKKRMTWLTYISNNLYTFLFFATGLVTIYGFIRLLQKKRAYKDEDDEWWDE